MILDIKKIAADVLKLPRTDIDLKAILYEAQMAEQSFDMTEYLSIANMIKVILIMYNVPENQDLVENLTAVVIAAQHAIKKD